MAVMNGLSVDAVTVLNRWSQFRNRELSKDEFTSLSDQITQFFESVVVQSSTVNKQMTDIMLAQDYQDITGQMIQQVVTMVKEVEEKLVRLVAITGLADASPASKKEESKAVNGEIAVGPQLPNVDKEIVVSSQSDVDDLLASLGF
jgi:chemotaxis protein CheZ